MQFQSLASVFLLLTAANATYIPLNSSDTVETSAVTNAVYDLNKRQCGGQMIECNGVWRCCFDSVSSAGGTQHYEHLLTFTTVRKLLRHMKAERQ